MAAVRNLFSSLNSLAHSSLLASGWLRPPDDGRATADASAGVLWPEAEGPYVEGGVEPPLDELLDDPVVQQLMRADRLEPDEVRRVLTLAGRHAAP